MERQDSVSVADESQHQKMARKTRLLGIACVVIGLFVAVAVPVMLTQQGEQRAESYVDNFSRGGSAAGAAFEGVLRADIQGQARRNAEEVRTLGFMVVIAGIAMLAMARNATAMGFLVRQQAKR